MPILNVAGVEVDTVRTVKRSGHILGFSKIEPSVLECLAHRTHEVVSKEELRKHLHDFDWEHHSNLIDVHISNLRRQLSRGRSRDDQH